MGMIKKTRKNCHCGRRFTDAVKIKNELSLKFQVILFLIVVSGGIGFYACSPQDEGQAKDAVSQHLNAIRTGKSDPYDTVDTGKVKEIFINVLDYKFLTVLKKEKRPTILDFNRHTYKMIPHKETYEEYIESFKKAFEKDLKEGRARLIGDGLVIDLEPHFYFELLYDVEITNRLGQKLYKKVVFGVEKLGGKYLIVSFRER
jgi:hypothetical protein